MERRNEMYASLHNHTDYSNASLGFADSIIKYNQLIDTAYELGLSAVSITDHEGIISHVKALQHYNKMDLQRPFKLILGNEIYLLSEAQDNIMRNNEEGGVPYYHFLLNALNNKGHEQIRRLSDRAWKRSYTYHGIVRTPTYYSDLEEIIGSEKGNVIASSACLGSFIDKSFLQGDTQTAISAMKYFDNLFGHGNFFLEIQPCYDYNIEQKSVNEFLWKSGQELDIPVIVTTDSHYLNKDSAYAHKVLLNAKDGGDARETEEFYATTYLMGAEELRNYLHLSFSDEQIDIMFENTNSIAERVEGYKFQHPPMIPMRPLADLGEFHITHRYKEYYDKYTEFGYYANVSMENNPYKEGADIETLVKQDQYVFYRLEKALVELVENKGKDVETYIDRLNKELHELRLISENFNSSMASYYTCMSKIIELIWEVDSLSMPSRGSGMGYVICYLLEITQIDPVPLGSFAPHWRHLSAERGVEIADIDDDSQNSRREDIINAMINYFGEDRVLNVLTVSTLSGKTAVEKAGKGLKKLGVPITDETIGYFKSLVPTERGQVWSLKDCFYGNEEKGRRPVNELVIGVEEYAGMKECMFAFEGLIINRGIHASGVLVGNNPYVEQISAMRSPTGVLCSCYDLHDAEYCGWTKVDILTIQASDKIRKTMDLLIEHGKMEWQGSLKKTYWKYLHPDVLDYETPAMWEMIKQIYSIFQFDTPVAVNALNKVNPRSVMDLSATNSLLRLMAREGRESPLELYARYHNDINEWYKDMDEYGLTKEEQEILKEHLSGSYGLADSQEKVMLLSMDERVSGFTLKEANTLRKSIAKKRADVLEETKIKFYNGCRNQGCSDKLANYVWEEQFGMSFGYVTMVMVCEPY